MCFLDVDVVGVLRKTCRVNHCRDYYEYTFSFFLITPPYPSGINNSILCTPALKLWGNFMISTSPDSLSLFYLIPDLFPLENVPQRFPISSPVKKVI